MSPFEHLLQIIEIVVIEDAEFRPAEPRGVHEAGVNKLVEDDDVVVAEQGADRAGGGGIAGGKTERRFDSLESSERLLQFVMRRERTAKEP